MGAVIGVIIVLGIILVWFHIPYSPVKRCFAKDIENLKISLADLHTAFMTDIEQINAELEYNYGWLIVGHAKGSVRTENIEEEG